jgi:hypothetical protein
MDSNNKAGGAPSLLTEALRVLEAARTAVPAVNYALGAAGIAAAGAIVTFFIGETKAAAIIFGAMIVAMVLLFAFSRLIVAKSAAATNAGIVLLWAVTIFFCVFLVFTTTAVAFGWPLTWASVLGLQQQQQATNCAPILDNEHIVVRCDFTAEEARAATRETVGEITSLIASVLSQKDLRLFPKMEEYLNSTDDNQRKKLWSDIKEVISGKTGLLTIVSTASNAILALDTQLQAAGGLQLAADPVGARTILLEIQKSFNKRINIGEDIQGSENPPNSDVQQWYDELKTLVEGLQQNLSDLQTKLAQPV